jgi:hypothetical protein
MRAVVLTAGSVIGGGFVLLGLLVLIMGEAQVPTRGADFSAVGMPAYAMGIAWLGLGVSLFCMGLLAAEVGPKYYVRKFRDAAFLLFGAGLVTALVLAILKVHGNVAL